MNEKSFNSEQAISFLKEQIKEIEYAINNNKLATSTIPQLKERQNNFQKVINLLKEISFLTTPSKNEVVKVGRTFIKDENITFAQFKAKYNMPNYKIEWDVKEDELGHTLCNADESKFWWVGEEFFKQNYKLI